MCEFPWSHKRGSVQGIADSRAGVEAQIVETLTQGPDHSVSIHFPEGAYLKGLVCVKG